MRRPGSQGPSSGGLFSAIGLRWGVSFGFLLLLTLIVDAPLWWNEAAEETNLSTGPNGGRVSLYAVSPSCPRRGESNHDKPGRREERLEKPGAPGQPFYFTAARCRLMTASASNFKPAEMKGQCNSRCRGRLYFDLIGSLGGGRRAEARGHVPWLSPNGCGRVPVAPAVTNSSPPRRRVCDHRREGRASNPDGGASLSQPAQPW